MPATSIVFRTFRICFAGALVPGILVQRQALADHLTRLLDKLPEHAPNVSQAIVILPDNGRDRHLAAGRTTNGQHSAQQSPATQWPTPTAIVELPPRRGGDSISSNGDQAHDGADREGPRT